MEEIRTTINDILIINQGNYLFEFINLKNNAGLSIMVNGLQYYDPFGNSMISYPTALVMDDKVYSLKKIGDEVKTPSGTSILLPFDQILEIASKTFYEDGQFRPIDFLTFNTTKEK
ncbi:hypothetical protein RB619_19230 [Flavobacterium sp. LHD-80]|uniref:hypothetical protein n=1 Tax=Flavobacterium sp. LHD-80 TaxID=3071411 RepID=UPI0027E0D50E|nr:hypothetical protein [Flavobacterium sp. LHD-80]MDQ6472778.1 hypothetical protein [Flavobacterium sp. LHD-80]